MLAFLAAVALAKYRFSGRSLFIVLMIGILMLPQVGLIIPLYVVLARYHMTNALTGVIVVYLTFLLPFAIWTLRGFILGIPKDLEEAAMVDGSSRVGAFIRILLPLVAPGLVATAVFAFITAWNEFIFASVILQDQSKQTLTVWLASFYGTSQCDGLGRAHGRVDADGDPGCVLLPRAAAEDPVRPYGRRRESVTGELERLAATCILPGFEGRDRAGLGTPSPRRGPRRGGAVRLERREPRTARGAHGRPLRASEPTSSSRSTRRAATSRGSRRQPGARIPGNGALGVVDDVELTERVAASMGAELAAVGVNLDFAPVADVNTNPQNPVIGIRSFGSDEALVARHVSAFVRGLQTRRPRPRVRSTSRATATRRSTRISRSRRWTTWTSGRSSRSAPRSRPECDRS